MSEDTMSSELSSSYVQVVEDIDNIDALLSTVSNARNRLNTDLARIKPDFNSGKSKLLDYIDSDAFNEYHKDNQNPDNIVNYRIALDNAMADLKDSIEFNMNSIETDRAKVRILQLEIESKTLDIQNQVQNVNRYVCVLKECLSLLLDLRDNLYDHV